MTPTAQRMRNFLFRSARFVRASFVASGLALIAACVSSGSSPGADDVGLPETFDVLALNMWHGGDAGKRPLEDTLRVLRTAAPDAVCFQEVRGLAEGRPDNAEALSARMGWSYMAFSGGRGVATRHRFAGRTRHAAIVELPSGRRVHVASVHLPAAPYQPYQLARIPYEGGRFISTEAEAIAEAKAARLANLEALLEDLEDPLDDDEPVVVAGDFNEPSHLDWTAAAARAGACPIAVRWPGSALLEEAGLQDAWRVLHPDPLAWPGHTWTPITRADDPQDRHDRIDRVHHRGAGLRPVRVKLVGESSASSDLVVAPWPSDHRGVLVSFLATGAPAD